MKRNPWATLAVVALGQFMVVLDITIVNVALPDIQTSLGFGADDLQWVVSAYTLVFGGLLLLGGRAADLLGRRRLFVAGLVVFALASLAGGFAGSPGVLIAARVVQGLGGALMSPAALSILTVTFPHGRERNVAMGIWGGLAGLGGTLGVIAGGLLVDSAGWEWVFFVNVPVAAVLLVVTPRFVGESRLETDGVRSFDTAGALLGTAGMFALVFGVIRTEPLGWGSGQVIGSLVAAVVLLVAFAYVESRSPAPLVPLRLFRSRGLTTSSLALALNGAAFLGMFFLTAIYLQQVRGLSALETGVQILPMGVAAILGAVVASTLVTRVGTRPVQLAGSALSIVGLVLLAQADADGSYAVQLLPGFLLFGLGIMAVGAPAQIGAVAEVSHDDAGAAAGLVSTGYQVGGALGLAVITTISTSHVTDLLSRGIAPTEALVEGFQRGLLVAAAIAAVNLVTAALAPQVVPDEELLAEAVAV